MIDSNNLRFVSWNVNGLKQCTDNGFQKFFKKADADFFSVQTTKMSEQEKKFSFNGYYEFWNDSKKENYSGTLIYTKHKPLSIAYGLPNGEYADEGRLMTLEYDSFFLINCYVPNSTRHEGKIDYRLEFEDAVRKYYQNLISKKPVIINGDLNIVHTDKDTYLNFLDTTKAGYTDKERTKFEELLSIGFVDSFRYTNPFTVKYSMWSYQSNQRRMDNGQRSDYFLLPKEVANKIKNVDILTDVRGSNHCPIVMDLNYPFSTVFNK